VRVVEADMKRVYVIIKPSSTPKAQDRMHLDERHDAVTTCPEVHLRVDFALA